MNVPDNNKTIQIMIDFIKAAETSRKYLPNVAANYRTPLRLIGQELNEEESQSIESFKNNLDQIFAAFYSRNQAKISASSIEIYKKRIRNLISDYENYGSDPSKMAAWNREVVTRKIKGKTPTAKQDNNENQSPPVMGYSSASEQVIDIGVFKLVLPKNDQIMEALMNGDFKTVKDEIKKLSDKFDTRIKNENTGGLA